MSTPFPYAESHTFVQSPNPTFKPVVGNPDSEFAEEWKKRGTEVGFTAIDPEKHEPRAIYRLLIGGVVPRPIAFVSSLSAEGLGNLAPFSYFNVVSHNPPLISIAFSHSPTRPKDTCLNIKATKTFTVNIISEPFVEAANWCSVDAPVGVEEWIGSGLTKEKSTTVAPARVKESAFSLECELFQYIDISPPSAPSGAPPTSTLVLGLIKMIHIRNDVLITPENPSSGTPAHSGYNVDATKLRAVSRLGGITYGRIGEGFQIPRPVWDEVKGAYEGVE